MNLKKYVGCKNNEDSIICYITKLYVSKKFNFRKSGF